MKKIILKKLELLNFKGVRKFTLEPSEDGAEISAKNGRGKTSVFDAFCYLLFGKDSFGNAKFNIKTLDANEKPIPKLPHEVSAELLIDGEPVSLRRCYVEKWTKHRGEFEETFEGNTEEYYYNEVPLRKKDYEAKIAEICDEDIFKLITSPSAFPSLPWKKQRDLLVAIAGGVTDEDIAKDNKPFQEILEHLTGKTLEEYQKEVANKRKKIRAEVDTLPHHIDEVMRSMPEKQDRNKIEEGITTEQNGIKEIDDILTDLGSAQTAAHEEHNRILNELSTARQQQSDLVFKIKTDVQKEYFEAARKRSEINNTISGHEREIQSLSSAIASEEENLHGHSATREALIKQWKEIKAEKFSVSAEQLECPTCHRPFEQSEIETITADLRSKWNESQAKRIEANTARGKEEKASIERCEALIAQYKQEQEQHRAEIVKLQADPVFSTSTEPTDAQPIIEANEEYKALSAKIAELEAQANKPIETPNNEEREKLKVEKAEREAKIKEFTLRLATCDEYNRSVARKEQLEDQLSTMSQELVELERTEYYIQQFNKAKIDAISDKINALFTTIKFRLFSEQVNGGMREDCEAVVNGVPYSSRSQAEKVLDGLEIIQVLRKYFDISSPLFLEAAESIDHKINVDGMQIIELRVSRDNETLTVK